MPSIKQRLSRSGAIIFALGFAASAMLPDSSRAAATLPAKAEAGVVRTLLVSGGSASHDWETFFHQADTATLRDAGNIITAYTTDSNEAIQLMANADVLVLSANAESFGAPDFQQALNAFADTGRGVVILHASTWFNWTKPPGFNQRFVGGGARSHGLGTFSVFNRKPTHPVMQGVPADFKITDEIYHIELGEFARVTVLAETAVDPQTQKAYPSVWIVKDVKAKIVDIALGHAADAHGNPAFQKLLVNAVRWAAVPPPKLPVRPVGPTPSVMETAPDGWIDLLADETLSRWKQTAYVGKPLQPVLPWFMNTTNHTLECRAGVDTVEMYLYDQVFRNGTFHCEWRFRPVKDGSKYNSGVLFRCSSDGAIWHQAQVGDRNVGFLFGKSKFADSSDGVVSGFMTNDRVTQRSEPAGAWNTYEITTQDSTVTLWMNGYITATISDCVVPAGRVGLEAEGWAIEFRNVKFRPAP
jgi:uncharacterized protein